MSEAQEQPRSPKLEISPSGEAGNIQSQKPIVESKVIDKKSSGKPRKGISKGQLAARLMASAAITATIGLKGDTMARGLGEESISTPTGAVRELSIQELERRAETHYQIQIISPKELPDIDFNGKKLKVREWTEEAIIELTTSLDELPSHFYSPAASIHRIKLLQHLPEWTDEEYENIKQQEYKATLESLKIIGKEPVSKEDFDRAKEQGYLDVNLGVRAAEFLLVDNLNDQEVSGVCFCFDPFTKQRIAFPYTFFKDVTEVPRLSGVAHELVHRTTKPEDEIFISRLLELPEGASMQELLKPNVKKVPVHLGIYVRHYLDHGSEDPDEFLAVGSEFYLQGEKRFQEVYGVFIGKDKAERFYDHMRDNIFKGTEYNDYQKINNSGERDFSTSSK